MTYRQNGHVLCRNNRFKMLNAGYLEPLLLEGPGNRMLHRTLD